MELPSRRDRKQPRSVLGLVIRILTITAFLILAGLLTFMAIQTQNYLGLTAVSVLLFFGALAGNVCNIRRYMPGLHTIHPSMKLFVGFVYAGVGLTIIFAASMYSPEPTQISDIHSVWPNQHAALPPISTPPLVLPPLSEDANTQISQETPPKVNSVSKHIEENEDVSMDSEKIAAVMKQENEKRHMVASRIVNGNMIEVEHQTIRLIGINVPEEFQEQATLYLQSAVLNKEIEIESCSLRPRDDYDRIRAVIKVKGVNINQQLIEQGLTLLIVTQPCSIDMTSWADSERIAKENGRGIWRKRAQ